MILIDTNVVLASIRQPVTPQDVPQHEMATSLFDKISTGETTALISEIVLHECFYVLVMRDKSIATEEFCSLFRRLLTWAGWSLGDQEMNILRSALDILQDFPKLEFSDSVIAARAEFHDAELATFDSRLAKAFTGNMWSGGT